MAFRQSDASIYKTMQYDGILKDQVTSDVTRILAPLAGQGYYWEPSTMTLKTHGPKTVGLDTPWCHAAGTHTKNCLFDHHVAFNNYHIIPPRCMECWKVVATPNSFKQLMEMEVIQKDLPFACKCGIELRDYTPKHYGSYFYNDSLDEGREKYEIVRELCDKHIEDGKDISVILKRGCTEFEMIKGPSPFWHMTKEEERIYEILTAYVHNERNNRRQPMQVKQHVKSVWALWAHANGDMSYLPWNNNKPLFPDYVKYHEGDIDGIKADLAIARAQTRGKVKPDDALEFLQLANDFANNKDIPLTSLIHTLGVHERDYLNLQTIPLVPELEDSENTLLDSYSEKVIGEHDELT